jgi:hypothetical protein
MISGGGGQSRAPRLAIGAIALLVLLAVVSLASRSGFGHASEARPTPSYVSWAMSIFLVVFVLMIPFAIYAYSMQIREYRSQKERQKFQSRVAKSVAVILVLAAIGMLRIYFGHKFFPSFHSPMSVNAPPNAGGKNGLKHAVHYNPTFQWPVLWATIAVLAVVAGWIVFKLRRGELAPLHALGEEPSLADEVTASIDDAIDDLEAEPDPRRAVIAAYARMENALRRSGLARAVSETPLEYLGRILLGLGSRADAVTRLTDLFEQAKFSTHRIDGSMKDEAIGALRAIRADVQGAAA